MTKDILKQSIFAAKVGLITWVVTYTGLSMTQSICEKDAKHERVNNNSKR